VAVTLATPAPRGSLLSLEPRVLMSASFLDLAPGEILTCVTERLVALSDVRVITAGASVTLFVPEPAMLVVTDAKNGVG